MIEGKTQIKKFVKNHFYAHSTGGAIVILGNLKTYSMGVRIMAETSRGIVTPLTQRAIADFYEIDEDQFKIEQGKANRLG